MTYNNRKRMKKNLVSLLMMTLLVPVTITMAQANDRNDAMQKWEEAKELREKVEPYRENSENNERKFGQGENYYEDAKEYYEKGKYNLSKNFFKIAISRYKKVEMTGNAAGSDEPSSQELAQKKCYENLSKALASGQKARGKVNTQDEQRRYNSARRKYQQARAKYSQKKYDEASDLALKAKAEFDLIR